MTTHDTSAAPSARSTSTNVDRELARLRAVLRVNAAFSGFCGVLAVVMSDRVADELGLASGHAFWVRVVGVGLIGFAAGLVVLSRAAHNRLLADTRLIVAADLGWVVATAVVVATDIFSSQGDLIAVIVALVVLDFAILQAWTRSRAIAAER